MLGLVLGLVLFGSLGLGEPAPVAWSGEDACPGAAGLLDAEVERQLGPLRGQGDASLEVEVRIDAGPGEALELALTLRSDAGHERHRLRAGSCAALLEQAAVLIASARDPYVFAWRGPIDPLLGFDAAMAGPARPPVQRPSRRAEPASPPNDPEPTRPDASPETGAELPRYVPVPRRDASDVQPRVRAKAPVRGALGIAADGVVGLFPNVAGGVELEGALERGAFRWQLAGVGWFGGRFRASAGGLGGDLWALGSTTGLCGVARHERRVRVPLCVIGGAGAVVADAVGTGETRRSTQAWGWLGADARVQVLVTPRFALALGLAVQVQLVRPGWFVSEPDAEFRLPPATGILRLSGEFRGLGENRRRAAITSRGRGQ